MLVAAPAAHALEPGMGVCQPPRTIVALTPLADRTDGVWTNWTGESPATLVARLLADSLGRAHQREVIRVAGPSARTPSPASRTVAAAPLQRPVDDDQALRTARRTQAEVVVTGSVDVFSHDDHLEPGKFSRWGMGAPDARSRTRVSVTLRALDVRDGTVLIETTASRERLGKGVAMIDRLERAGSEPALDPALSDALGEVLGDLARTVSQQLEAHWKARVLSQRRGVVVLDAGASRGLFPGQRLDIWRPGVEVLDEDLALLGDDVWMGSVVITALEGRGRSLARIVDGEVRAGDLVKPCSQSGQPALSMKR